MNQAPMLVPRPWFVSSEVLRAIGRIGYKPAARPQHPPREPNAFRNRRDMLKDMGGKKDVKRALHIFWLRIRLNVKVAPRKVAPRYRDLVAAYPITRSSKLPAPISPRAAIVKKRLPGFAPDCREHRDMAGIVFLAFFESSLFEPLKLLRRRQGRCESLGICALVEVFTLVWSRGGRAKQNLASVASSERGHNVLPTHHTRLRTAAGRTTSSFPGKKPFQTVQEVG